MRFCEGRSKIVNENEHDGATLCKAVIVNLESASLSLTAGNASVSLGGYIPLKRPEMKGNEEVPRKSGLYRV